MKHLNPRILPLLAALCAASAPLLAAPQHPNVIFILADDLGWSDTTLYETTELFETPQIERLAREGLTFTRAYSASPLCSPTRASILTGQNPARLGLTAPRAHIREANKRLHPSAPAEGNPGEKSIQLDSTGALDTRLPTLGMLLSEAGYATGHFGKWHLGHPPYSPLEHGFEVDLPAWAGPGPAGSFVAPWMYPDFEANYPGEHIEDRMAEEAVAWMEEQVASDRPFYLQYWQFSVHAPFDAKEAYIEEFRGKVQPGEAQSSATYAAMVKSLDDAVGTLLDAVERLGIAGETVIIFTSDNGGNMYNAIEELGPDGSLRRVLPTSNKPLRGGKATLYEGGIRVPTIIHWPGLTPEGAVSDALIQSTDFYPTLLSLLDIPLPEAHPVDGEDFGPALRGEPFEREQGLITYFPHAPRVPDWLPPAVSLHRGNWKLIRIFHYGEEPGEHQYFLYNLSEDPGETNNLARQYPERVREMDREIEDYLKRARVLTPPPNPAFDPEKFRPEQIGVQPGGPRLAGARRKKPSAAAEPEVPRGAAAVGSWRGTPETVGLTVAGAEIIVHSTADDPWIAGPINPALTTGAPFTLSFELYSENSGPLRHYPSAKRGVAFRPEDKVRTVHPKAGEWILHEVVLTEEEPLTKLRIGLPGADGESRLRNIRLKDAEGRIVATGP